MRSREQLAERQQAMCARMKAKKEGTPISGRTALICVECRAERCTACAGEHCRCLCRLVCRRMFGVSTMPAPKINAVDRMMELAGRLK